MIWKFSKLLPLRKLALAGWVMALAAPFALAQAPPSAATPAPVAHVRFWNMFPQRDVALDLVNAAAPQSPFVSAGSRNAQATYVRTPPGSYSFVIHRAGKRDAPLRTVPVALKAGAFVTILAAPPEQAGGALRVEVIDDTNLPVDDKAPITARVSVRNFSTKAQQVQVTAQGQPPRSVSVGVGASGVIEGLPAGVTVGLGIQMTLADGSRVGADTEADFSKTRRASLLIFEDNYGRVRPRVTQDGVSEAAPTPEPTSVGTASPAPK